MKTLRKHPLWYAAAALGLIASVGWAATKEAELSPHSQQLAPMTNLSPEVEQAIESANNLSTAFRTVANRLLPTVVAIENKPLAVRQARSVRPSQDPFGGDNPFKGTPFEDMFRGHNFRMVPPSGDEFDGLGDLGRGMQRPSPGGIGSGVIIEASGLILTNNHVVAGGGEVIVKTHDGREYTAAEVWTDPKSDIAVVRIDATDLVAAPLGDSDRVEIGDWVVALGQPFGLESTVTAGIISAKNRGLGIADRENFLQTDAAINPGNSGGPLVNLRGEIIGINTAISSRSGGNEGIGFAVPSNQARWVSDQLVKHGTVRRAYLGVGIQPVTAALAKQLSVKPRGGVAVTEIFPSTPAAKSGLETGDVIVKFDGRPVRDPQELQMAVEKSEFGKSLTIDVVRNGKTIQLSYQPEEQPESFGARGKSNAVESQPSRQVEHFGLEVAPLDEAVAKQLGMSGVSGVVITGVKADTPAADAGLDAGMVITHVNRLPVKSVDEFLTAVAPSAQSDAGTLLLVRTENGSRFVVLK